MPFAAGAVDFFEKQYNSQQILDRIQLVLGDEEKRFPERAKRIELREMLKHLSPREREVLDGMLRGDASKVIARSLNISARTVDVHRAAVKEKLGCHSSAGLVRDVVLAFGPGILTQQVGGEGLTGDGPPRRRGGPSPWRVASPDRKRKPALPCALPASRKRRTADGRRNEC